MIAEKALCCFVWCLVDLEMFAWGLLFVLEQCFEQCVVVFVLFV